MDFITVYCRECGLGCITEEIKGIPRDKYKCRNCKERETFKSLKLRPVMVYEWVKETSNGLRKNKKIEKGKARFHEFGSNPLGTDINFAKTATIAIVEYEDGLVDAVRYDMIRFLDREGSKKDGKN